MIDRETVDRILDTADIVDVVSDFVSLRRSGANFKGLCPFHDEKTPSFMVSPAKQICHCFGCGKGGSPVNFVMEHEQMSYVEALRYLAKKYNIEIHEKELTSEEKAAQTEREAMLVVNEFAAAFSLNSQQAYRYLDRFKGIDFVDRHYDYVHTQSFPSMVADLTEYCHRKGGALV